ncbi:GNAT family N-acetyltransferase [uncultured Cohaesibacter sp.]|uniref:GNAT family N-acetyltransferase n=1 Tax=uncultured Cohaesibacter sp. TaxID=1002546 RepID=UPI0029C9A143|nr:GNAT family N-acetyltransferase [uncultured Cohaesibacter sp.]
MMQIPDLASERLILRPLRASDAPALAQHCQDFEISKYLAVVPHPYPKSAANDWLEKQEKGVAGINMAITKDDILMGVVGIKASSERDLGIFAPTIGYWLATAYWGKGFMQEAVRRLLDWYLPHEPTEKMCAAAFEDNPRSLNLLRNLGFEEVKRDIGYSLARGEKVPEIIMELTSQRFSQLGSAC